MIKVHTCVRDCDIMFHVPLAVANFNSDNFFLLTKWNFCTRHYHRKINWKQFFVKKWTKVASIGQLGKILCAEATIAANANVFPVVDYENRKCVCVRNFAVQKRMLYNSHSFDKFCKKLSNTSVFFFLISFEKLYLVSLFGSLN